MPAKEKKPWNPGATTENQWSWSNPDNWTSAEKTREWLDMHPFLDGRAFILQGEGDDNYNSEPDPYLFVDYDDVADADGAEPAPEAVELMNRLGLTYTDYSTSGTGLHQIFRGELPEDVRTIQFDLPDGAGEIEIYDCKRVCIMTGKHVADTPVEPQSVDEDALQELADEHGKQTADVDREDWTPTFDRDELESMDGTDNIDAIYDAIQQVEPRDIRLRSDLTEERGDGVLSFDPTWASSASGTRLGWDPRIGFIYRKGDVGLDALQVVALEEGIIRSVSEYPRGEDWWDAVDELRDRGAHIPEYENSSVDEDLPPLLRVALEADAEISTKPVSTLPLRQLDALSPAERRRAARTRGLEWPSTDEARERLFASITEVMANEDDRVVDAPTGLGKSYSIAATSWNSLQYEDITGNRPVVHLSKTRPARNEAIETAADADVEHFVLRSRDEACPVAAGDYDPPADAVDELDYEPITIHGIPASEWIQTMCEGRGLPFSEVHRYLEQHNDQDTELPCASGGECPAIKQWDEFREHDHSLILATHQFLHVPGLRMYTNIVVDEEPDFEQELSQETIRRSVTAFLKEVDAEIRTFERLVEIGREGLSRNEHDHRDFDQRWEDLYDALATQPDREWYFENENAHTLAPALARAILNAEQRGNGRRAATVPYEPPRLDANAHDEESWNRQWVTLVLDEDNTIRNLRVAPDLSLARSVVGLDAHPALPVWQRNTLPHIQKKSVLEPEERRLWRRYERGLRVVQVGSSTNPIASEYAVENYYNEGKTEALVEHLREEYGEAFSTGITTKRTKAHLRTVLANAGVTDPDLMHYGAEKSRNDFQDEDVGLVNGCIDPGDGYVLDLLAELDLDARPERSDVDCEHCDGAGCHECNDTGKKRARGRGFVGEDSDTAAAILGAVRENHTAQAAGRYARNPEDPSSTATVFVRTDAMPTGFVDVQVPGVEWVYSSKQAAIVEQLREATGAVTAKAIADDVDASKRHVQRTLKQLVEEGLVQAFDGGPNGAVLYSESGLPHTGVVDLESDDEVTTAPVRGSYTWSVAIRDPEAVLAGARGDQSGESSQRGGEWDWRTASDGGGPPD